MLDSLFTRRFHFEGDGKKRWNALSFFKTHPYETHPTLLSDRKGGRSLFFEKKKIRFLFITTIKPISLFPSLLQNELVKKRERFNAARRIGWNRSRSKHVEHASTMGINQRGSRWVEREWRWKSNYSRRIKGINITIGGGGGDCLNFQPVDRVSLALGYSSLCSFPSISTFFFSFHDNRTAKTTKLRERSELNPIARSIIERLGSVQLLVSSVIKGSAIFNFANLASADPCAGLGREKSCHYFD